MRRQWRLQPQDPARAGALARELGLPQAVGQLLLNRGVETPDAGRRYLDRKLTGLHDPAELPGLSNAADVLHAAAAGGKKLCIYGDYDVDGMCATAILLECFRIAGIKAEHYVPDRMEEGYGVNAAALRKLRAEGIEALVTVDCGIASAAEAGVARELGLTYVVTDHHALPETLPAADAVAHPRLPGQPSPFGDLCGAGVAYKLAWELARRFSGARRTTDEFRKFLLDATTFAAIGTVCDVVPLAGENRVLVHHGLRSLTASPPLGLRALMQSAGLAEKAKLTSGDVGFTLGPRLNAAGRLGTARLGVELLTTRDEERAARLAEYLDNQNKERQLLERRMVVRARELAEERYRLESGGETPALVLADDYAPDRWHPGVLGIVAGRMAERTHRPCVLIAWQDDAGSGSGRSAGGVDLHALVGTCREHLVAAGGHAMAVGVRLEKRNFAAFRELFEARAAEVFPAAERVGVLRLDAETALDSLTLGAVQALEALEPFGFANAAPLLLATNVRVVGEPKKVGNGERHLSFRVQQGQGSPKKAIGFDMGDRLEELMSAGGAACLAFTPQPNTFNGYTSVDLRLRDFRPGPRLED